MLEEFKKFAIKGNVIDMAVGVIIGAAFGKIVTSLVENIIMPPIGVLLNGVDFSHLAITLIEKTENTSAVTIQYGVFLNTIINFLIIAFVIFLLVKQINRFKKEEEVKAPETPEEVLLLREIRDNIKKK
ncbi:MAG: large-conductance mechanosensitive channel protein MscL [Candidatus Peregrinibacteria bacterium]